MSEEWYLRCRQGCRDKLQDIGITFVCIIKTRYIDKEYTLSVESEFTGDLDFCGKG